MENTENKTNMSSIMDLKDKIPLPASIIVAGLLIAGAILISNGSNKNNEPTKAPLAQVKAVGDSDHILGDRKAKIVVVEYSDTECPFCKKFHETMHQVVSNYGGDVAWVYRHFPLDSLHSKARKEAEAVECAFELGDSNGYWKYLDRIFEITPSNNQLEQTKLAEIATFVGLDATAFTTCLDSGKYTQFVEDQYQSGVAAGAQGTPHSFILKKGKTVDLIQGAESFESIKAKIDALLK